MAHALKTQSLLAMLSHTSPFLSLSPFRSPFKGASSMSSSVEATPLAIPHTMDLQAIMACIPHRYPFLLVDKVVAHEHGPGARTTVVILDQGKIR